LIDYTSDAVDNSTSTIIDVLANDTDEDGDTLSITTATAEHGIVIINSDGTLTYKPQSYFEGEDTIYYTVSDGEGGTSESSVNVFVGYRDPSENSTPWINNLNGEYIDGQWQSVMYIAKDTQLNINLQNYIYDPDGDKVSISVDNIVLPDGLFYENGMISGSTSSTNGSIEITLNDGHGGINTQTIQLIGMDAPIGEDEENLEKVYSSIIPTIDSTTTFFGVDGEDKEIFRVTIGDSTGSYQDYDYNGSTFEEDSEDFGNFSVSNVTANGITISGEWGTEKVVFSDAKELISVNGVETSGLKQITATFTVLTSPTLETVTDWWESYYSYWDNELQQQVSPTTLVELKNMLLDSNWGGDIWINEDTKVKLVGNQSATSGTLVEMVWDGTYNKWTDENGQDEINEHLVAGNKVENGTWKIETINGVQYLTVNVPNEGTTAFKVVDSVIMQTELQAVGTTHSETWYYGVDFDTFSSTVATIIDNYEPINDTPTDILLSQNSVFENHSGAVIGKVTTRDNDDSDFRYSVNDDRFEVVDGNLKLKDGVSLDYESESTVSLDITTQDSANNSYTETFNINVKDIDESNPNNQAPIANQDSVSVEPWYDYENDVVITSASLNVNLGNVNLTIGQEYSDGDATLKMTSATAGTITAPDGLMIDISIINGELVGTYQDVTFTYRLLAGDNNTITLIQTDTPWIDAMNSESDRQGPPEFWSLMSSSETADTLPTSGEITIYGYGHHMNEFGDKYGSSVKSVVNFTDKTIQDYYINGNLKSQSTFTVASDGKTMLIYHGDVHTMSNENSSTQVQIMSNIDGKMVFKFIEQYGYSLGEGSADGATDIYDWLALRDNNLWEDDYSGNYMKVIFKEDGVTVDYLEENDDGYTEIFDGEISSDGKSITVIYGDGTEKYTVNTETNSIYATNDWQNYDFASTTQLIDYTFEIINNSTSTIIDVLANDTDVDGDLLSVISAISNSGAKVLINEDGTLSYTPPVNYYGKDIVNYLVSDGKGGISESFVEVFVGYEYENQAPVFYQTQLEANDNNDYIGSINAYDPNGDYVSYTIVGGDDKELFFIDEYGQLRFKTAPDYENPQDVGADNVYNLDILASDGQGGETTQSIEVKVNPNQAPIFYNNHIEAYENNDYVSGLYAYDQNGDSITYTIVGGDDKELFFIDEYGQLRFKTAPDYENPQDVGADNVYNLDILASDGQGGESVQSFEVKVKDIDESHPNNHVPIANQDSVVVKPWDNYEEDVTITSASLNTTLNNVELTIGKEYGDGEATLKMNTQTTGVITLYGSEVIDIEILDGELVGMYDDISFQYKLLASDDNSITLVQTDNYMIDIMNSDVYRNYFLPEFWSLVSAEAEATLLPTNGEMTFNWYELEDFGDYNSSIKTVVNFETKSTKDYDINGNLIWEDNFMISEDGRSLLFDFDGYKNEVQILSNVNGNMVLAYNYMYESFMNQVESNGENSIHEWLSANNNYLWLDEEMGYSVKVVFASDGVTIDHVEKQNGDYIEILNATISSDGKSISINNEYGLEKYVLDSSYLTAYYVETGTDYGFSSSNQLIDYTFEGGGDIPTSTIIDVLANDTDVDGDFLSVISAISNSGAKVTINEDGTLNYTPPANYNGMDVINYTISDGKGGMSESFVEVFVEDGNSTQRTGYTTTDFGGNDVALSLQLDGSGNIYLGGFSNDNFALAKYNFNGELDTTFGGGDGMVTTDFGYDWDWAWDLELDGSGNIYLGGETNGDFALAKYTSDGELDTSFGGGDGKVTHEVSYITEYATLEVDLNGYIYVGGGRGAFELIKCTPNGEIDASFGGGDGMLITDFSSGVDEVHNLQLDTNGNIYLGGVSANNFALAKYTANGELDTSFGGGDGMLTTDFGGYDVAYGLQLDGNGNIYLGGFSNDNFALAKYNFNGELDTTFGGGDGMLTTDFGGDDNAFTSLELDSNGNIYLGGHSDRNFALAKYTSDGELDTSFGGGDGMITTDFGGVDTTGGLKLDGSGNIYLGGFSDGNFIVAKYTPNGELDTSFGDLVQPVI